MITWGASIPGSFTAIDVSTTDYPMGKDRKNALYIGTSGDLAVIGAKDEDVITVFKNVPVGYHLLDIKTIKNAAGGTTASDIVVLV